MANGAICGAVGHNQPMAGALVLLSPAARRGGNAALRAKLRTAIEDALAKRGFKADFPEPTSVDEARVLLRAAREEDYELVVTAGGDGSVRLAADALAGTEVPLGIVPMGTGNLLAAVLGTPRQSLVAAARLADAEPVIIDTGMLDMAGSHETFAVAAGLGFDARVMRATNRAAKARFGVLAYFATIARLVPSLPAAETEIVVDGRIYQLTTVALLIANCGQIVPGLLGPRAALDPQDGLLDVVAIRGDALPLGLAVAAASGLHSLVRGDTHGHGPSLRLRGKEVEVRTDPPEPAQVDGDLLPEFDGHLRATIRPRSLSVLV